MYLRGVATWRCKCGVTVKVITETDRARINEDIRHEAQCPNCGDRQIVYAHRILAVTMYNDGTAASINAKTRHESSSR